MAAARNISKACKGSGAEADAVGSGRALRFLMLVGPQLSSLSLSH
jgi:hypothetical protein